MGQMDAFLAQMYGNDKTAAVQEDTAKEASVDLFMKLAADQNIDLGKMSDEQVSALYNNWVKAASEEEHEEHEKEEKKEHLEHKVEEAKKEHEEKKAAAEKLAEADTLGRVMAHSFVAELRKVAAASEEEKKHEKKHEHEEHHKEEHHEKKEMPAFLKKHKEASALDQLAAVRAIKLASENNFDAAEAEDKVSAVLTLKLARESTKVASAPNVQVATEIRALELLEAAGYPVTWS